jgi:hypothetical protein
VNWPWVRQLEVVEARLVRIEGRVGPGRVELHGREPARGVLRGARRPELGVDVDVRRVAVLGVEVAVGTKTLVHAAAEQVVDRLPDGLADDVPARHLDATEHADERDIRPCRIAPAVDVAPECLDSEGVRADDVARADVLDHRRHRLRPERRGVDLPHALDAVIGDELQEDEVAAAEVRRRVPDDERLDARDNHLARGGGS